METILEKASGPCFEHLSKGITNLKIIQVEPEAVNPLISLSGDSQINFQP